MENLKIRNLTLDGYGCFKNMFLDFKRPDKSIYQWTVLLGNNNTGKTSVLKAIADLAPRVFVAPSDNADNTNKYVPSVFYDKYIMDYLKEADSSVTAVLSNDVVWGINKKSVKVYKDPMLGKNLIIIGYGVSRYPAYTSLSENKAKSCDTLFSNDSRLINIEEWLMQLDYASKNEKPSADNRLYKIKELICGNLFPEIRDFTFESSAELHNYVLFQTSDGWFRYTQLGYGYQSLLSWIIDLCKRMFDAYPDLQNPLEGGAVVLVDEIDLHLHPQWQRNIISYLSKAFPNVQFIVTTHSPLVVQSIDDVNLYVLYRDDEGNVCMKRPEQPNYNGWTVEEILRDTMGLDSDVFSDRYNALLKDFQTGLDEDNKDKVETAYHALEQMLHLNNPMRRLLELQKNLMR